MEFEFYPTNHSVARAEYEHPCIPYEMTGRGKTGFWAGFHAQDVVLDDVSSFLNPLPYPALPYPG